MSDAPLPLLWLYGPSGVGKSSAGWEVFRRLAREGVRTAFADTDQLALCLPEPHGGTHALRARNLAALWPGLRRAGVRCVVLTGVVGRREEVDAYTRLLPGARVTLCRLHARPDELRERFLGRGWLPDLVEAALADAEALERDDFADVRLDTTGRTVEQVAASARDLLPPAPPRHGPASDEPYGPDRAGLPGQGEWAGVPVLWFSGATAVGKSTVGYEVFRRLARAGTRVAYVDVRQVAAVRPDPDGDPGGLRLRARNLAAVWAGHRAAGARCLVVSGEGGGDAAVLGSLAGAALTVCRLHAGPATLAERVALRAAGGGPVVPGDELRGLTPDAVGAVAARAAQEAEALERAALEHGAPESSTPEIGLLESGAPESGVLEGGAVVGGGFVSVRVETDGRTPDEVADEVMERAARLGGCAGFPGPALSPSLGGGAGFRGARLDGCHPGVRS
ncbi:hypothetical protein AB0L05_29645 [Nonomuraea pusilla]|uniref:hypothetical protein n=1 Tax=Nonomuraea pusilla TaxID=46177 RepID=UPI003330392F